MFLSAKFVRSKEHIKCVANENDQINCRNLKYYPFLCHLQLCLCYGISIHIILKVYHAACCVKFISVYDSSINTVVELLLALATTLR